MNAQMNMSNTYRKVRALLAKTTANGCTPDEAASALQAAKDIVAKYAIDPARFDWPAEPPVPEAGTEFPTKTKRQRKPEPGTPRVKRGDVIMAMLRRKEGVSIAELQAVFGTQPHTVRAQISIETRKHGVKAMLKDKRYYLATE